MKSSHLLLSSLMAGTLLCSDVVLAQAAPAAAPATAGSTAGTDSATYQTAQGTLVVNSVAAPAPSIGPAPSFATLAGGGKSITAAQAAAYPPLANDFINADRNQDGKISKSEYAHWLKQL